MKNTIAILELYRHDEVLRHYCDMLLDSGYNIKIFCSKVVYENLEEFRSDKYFEWYIKKEEESIPGFLKSNFQRINDSDLVFVTTALNHFKAFYELSKNNKTVLLVHNAHSFLAPEKFLLFQNPIADRLRWLKAYFQKTSFYKTRMGNTLAGLAFPTEEIKNYVEEHFTLPAELKRISLPFACFQQKEKTQHNIITITIPCTVSSELRDYPLVLKAFRQIKDRLTNEIRLVLLGKPKNDGRQIMESFNQLKGGKIKLVTFDRFIPVREYEAWLLTSDFLILPLKKYGLNHIYNEQLGYSKISGGINDMIRFGIPTLISEHYPLDDDLSNLVERFSENNLGTKIEEWISKRPFLEKRRDQALFLEKYNKEKLQADFLTKIESLLNTV